MWCPKCKNEYRAGITICADCGSELVENLSEENGNNETDMTESDETMAGYNEAMTEYNETIAETAGEDGQTDPVIDGISEPEDEPAPIKPAYVPKRSSYEDNRSSAWTFFLVGGVGAVLVILHIAGVIDFNLTGFSRILTNSVMGMLFVIFIVIGAVSAKNASRYKKEALEEEAVTSGILTAFHETYTREEIDSLCKSAEAEGSYEQWNCRFQFIKDWITQNHPELIEEYSEYVSETIYNDMFPEN